MLTIHNIDKIIGTEIDTTNAKWSVEDVTMGNSHYTIKVVYVEGYVDNKVYPNFIYFDLGRNKQNGQYYSMVSSFASIMNWGLYMGHMIRPMDFIVILKKQLEHI